MKIGIFVDYANLYINIKDCLNLRRNKDIEDEVKRIIRSLEQYLLTTNKKYKNMQINNKIAYVLMNQGFGDPEESFEEIDLLVKKILSTKKSEDMKNMNQSQIDDAMLMHDVSIMAHDLDAVLIISNDGHFSMVAKQIQAYEGCLFWSGIYENKDKKASRYITNIADMVLPLHDIVNDIDEPEVHDFIEDEEEVITLDEPHIAIYYKGNNIFNYPLNKEFIEIGRRSTRRFHFPSIDLSEYDKEKVVSRQHGFIRKHGETLIFGVDENCSRPTWINGNPISKCEQIILKPGMQISLGDGSTGFGLEYVC